MNKLAEAFKSGFIKESSKGRKALKLLGVGAAGAGTLAGGGYLAGRYANDQVDPASRQRLREFTKAKPDSPKFFDKYVRGGSDLMNAQIAGRSGYDVVQRAREIGEQLNIAPKRTETTEPHYRAFKAGPLSARKQIAKELSEGKIPQLDKSQKRYKQEDINSDEISNLFKTFENEILQIANEKYDENYPSLDEISNKKQNELENAIENNPDLLSKPAKDSKKKLNELGTKIYSPAHKQYKRKLGRPILALLQE